MWVIIFIISSILVYGLPVTMMTFVVPVAIASGIITLIQGIMGIATYSALRKKLFYIKNLRTCIETLELIIETEKDLDKSIYDHHPSDPSAKLTLSEYRKQLATGVVVYNIMLMEAKKNRENIAGYYIGYGWALSKKIDKFNKLQTA